MSVFGGLIGALVAFACTAAILQPATSNLSPLTRALVTSILLGLSLLLGLMTGSAVGRRSRVPDSRIRMFSALAAAVCGGILGGALFAGLSAAYVRDYAPWPSGTFDLILAILAFPILGALGLCLGAITGFGVGALSGLVLAVVVPKRR
ncbi:MAG TPA: hypothetical protein VIO57_04460 [Chloroflexota bacterium]